MQRLSPVRMVCRPCWLALVLLAACNQQPDSSEGESVALDGSSPTVESTGELGQGEPTASATPSAGAPAQPTPDQPAEKMLEMPEVVMTAAQTETSLLKVGDVLPDATLPDLAGENRSIAELRGEQLTIVVFWSSDSVYSLMELAQVERAVASAAQEAEAEEGALALIAINEDADPTAAAEKLAEIGLASPVLVDSDRSYFSQVASKYLPRTYLIDAQGTILWFDIEWSRGTRRALEQAIRFILPGSEDVVAK